MVGKGAINFMFSEKENAKGREKCKRKKRLTTWYWISLLSFSGNFFVLPQTLFMFAAQAGPLVAHEVLYYPLLSVSTGLWNSSLL